MPQADMLIRSKLRLPFTRSALVPRLRLQEQIAQGLRGPLTLIAAPAGFGKTTLVASCIARCDLPVAWLSLDERDNQAERFLTYLVAALHGVDYRIGTDATQLVGGMQPAPPEAVLTSLVNDLDALHGKVALVLDDYHVIRSQAVHEAVAFLLAHCPQSFHLAIATRSDPPLPLARLRARGQMVELRAADLGFTEHEAAQFLNDVMGLGLDAGSVAALEERTEGWVAGLQMAALSMRGRTDVLAFIQAFSGTNRYILDYLLEEVLANQPPEIQRFLLHTSILDRLAAPLCDAVLDNGKGPECQREDRWTGTGSRAASRASSILGYLERANLFLVPLDEERTWYRYHHLFADLLYARLQDTCKRQDITGLHARAAQWYEQNGWTYRAIRHASLTSDDAWVERLIEQNYMEMFQRRDSSAIRSWTGELDPERIYRRPRLCIYEATSRSWLGQLDTADLFLDRAEDGIRQEAATPETEAMRGHLAYVRSRVTAMRGDVGRAIDLCLAAREKTPASNQALLGGIGVMLGYGYFLSGDFVHAVQTLDETIQSGITASAINSTAGAYCVLARLHAVQGRLHRSFEVYQKAAAFARKMGDRDLGAQGVVDVGMADVRCEWNDLDAALVQLQHGLALLPMWAKADDIALTYVTLARIHLAKANKRDARKAIEKAIQLVKARGLFSEARDAVRAAQVKLWLAQGELQAAARWAASQVARSTPDDRSGFENELALVTQARVSVALNRSREALTLLSHLEDAAQSAGRMGRVLEILLLKALAMRETGDTEHAIAALTQCLRLAEPEGYARIFLDEGRPMQMLLAQWLARAGAGPLRDYAVHLVSQFDAAPRGDATVQEAVSPASHVARPAEPGGQALVEPLSQREMEVLHLMSLGKTNKAIARQLIIAPGTVKAHAASIYRKLDVANRTEAVARARHLGILP
jgi:ATP/maltotriose-dependent transcriptional regulator MalT